MRMLHWLPVALLCLSVGLPSAAARDGRDTLMTRMGDRVIVPYECIVLGDRLTITYRPAIIHLGKESSRRYKNANNMTVVIFDRKGTFQDAVFVGDIVPETFTVPATLSYVETREGYYLLHEKPSMTFDIIDKGNKTELVFPAYLAYHVRKGKYRLIAPCGWVKIKADTPTRVDKTQKVSPPELAVATIEVESDNEEVIQVLDCIANITKRLSNEDRLPMSESLEEDVRLLRGWRYHIKDEGLKDRANEALDAYEAKKRQLELAAEAAALKEQQRLEEELETRSAAEEERRRQEAESSRKRNVWMIIGGVTLGAAALVGNQLIQGRRNRKNQENMMEMQQSIVKKAENEAKNRAQAKARSQVMHTANKARGNAEQALKNGAKKVVRKNKNIKNISI